MAYYPPYYGRGNYMNPMQPTPQMPVHNVPQMEYQPQYQQMPMAQPAPTNDMIWVLNESEATSYPVVLNNSVVLWDKNNPTIYIKSMNAQGVPSMRVLDFNERMPDNAPKTPVGHNNDMSGMFAPMDDFKRLQSEFEALQSKVNALSAEKEGEKDA